MTDVNETMTAEEIEAASRVPTCPFCSTPLTDAPTNYMYRRLHPDTRWFWCESCQSHLGRHRMRRSWTIDPYDEPKLREKGYIS